MNLDDMKVCSEQIELTEDEWEELRPYACFSHTDACEEIIHIPEEQEYFDDTIEPLKQLPVIVIETMKESRKQGYRYICFYA